MELTHAFAHAPSIEELVSIVPRDLIRSGEESLQRSKDLNLSLISFRSPSFPERLRVIDLPPLVLFVKSKHKQFEFPRALLGIVGARAASIETCHRTARLSHVLAEAGFTIVSGLALGIDGAAHRGALECSLQCPTIAVVAHGLDIVYPPTHHPLAEMIVEQGGALISEYPPGVTAYKHHFLERNRIIAGLSQGVVVVAAGERSGSLVTARCAADFGRDVFVDQGDEREGVGSGAQRLLDDGAIPIACAGDVLAEYGIQLQREEGHDKGWITLSISECRARLGVSEADILKMELTGRATRLPGNRVSVRMD
jgi:DNA processing protein